MNERMDRPDYQATSDPAVMESADRGQVELLSYGELYNLWERQQWAVQDIDFTQDRIDWHERIPEEERYQRMYGLSSFFIGEQKVAEELGPMMRACPHEDMRIFLCTQIADEARHVAFFDRFYTEVGVLESDNLGDRLEETSAHLNENFGVLFDEMLKSRVDRLAAEPEDLETLVEAITLYHMVIEGMLALTGQHFIIEYNEQVGTLPGFVEGFKGRPRRAPPRGLRRALPARHGPERHALRGGHPAHAGGVRPGRRRRAATAVGRGGRGALRREPRGDARVRDEGARAPDEGHRTHPSYQLVGFPATGSGGAAPRLRIRTSVRREARRMRA